MAAGEWRSRVGVRTLFVIQLPTHCFQAIASYLDLGRLEHDVALEAAMCSDDDDWID